MFINIYTTKYLIYDDARTRHTNTYSCAESARLLCDVRACITTQQSQSAAAASR